MRYNTPVEKSIGPNCREPALGIDIRMISHLRVSQLLMLTDFDT